MVVTWTGILLGSSLGLFAATLAAAQSLPVRHYDISDGLIHNSVGRVSVDAHGFVWAASGAGVSRFDGHEFVNYTMADGLPDPVANHVFTDSHGRTWIATNGGGLAMFRVQPDTHGRLFDVMSVGRSRRSNRVNKLIEAHGRMWAATDEGLFRAEVTDAPPTFSDVPLDVEDPSAIEVSVFDLTPGDTGSIWLATSIGLLHLAADGRTSHYFFADRESREVARWVAHAPDGVVWVAHADRVVLWRPLSHDRGRTKVSDVSRPCVVSASAIQPPIEPGTGCLWPARETALGNRVPVVYSARDGSILVSQRNDALVQVQNAQSRTLWSLPDGVTVHNLEEDRQGHIWVASDNGVYRLVRSGIVTWGSESRQPFRVMGLVHADNGEVYGMGHEGWIYRVSERGMESTRPVAVAGAMTGALVFQTPLRDRNGAWWIGTARGLYRFPPVAFDALRTAQPSAIYRVEDGLPSNLIGRLFEDHRGDIWIASRGNRGEVLARWQRATDRIHTYRPEDGVPSGNVPFVFAEDAKQRVWIGFRDGGLGRIVNDRFELLADPSLRDVVVQSVYFDRRQRMWLGTRSHGVLRIDDPDQSPWNVTSYAGANGVQNGGGAAITEDVRGGIYVGGASGVDRIDPVTGRVSHLAAPWTANVLSALADRDGRIWFGTTRGVSQLTQVPEPPARPPTVRIRSVRVAGVESPLSPLGVEVAPEIRTNASRNRIEIEFFGLDEALDDTLQYQMQLENVDDDWSPLTSQRAVTYANLRPGQYRFLVRSVDSAGHASDRAATAALIIDPPFWQRAWFLGLTAAIGFGLIYGAYRYRLQHMLAVERVRTRIAADLHDDIGSNLSKVALLSEVVQRDAALAGAASTRLASMASIAHESIESMADIVWAVDPSKDRVRDLVQRMRSFAEEQFAAAGIAFSLDAPDEHSTLVLGADVRREVLLIFKEAVNNAVRHARCEHASVTLHVTRARLTLTVDDDGCGFTDRALHDGNGLRSMRERAKRLGGTLTVVSRPDQGTQVTLTAPLGQRL
ncbi:MAG TPA: two-component regulator propeller domain-containing protein [Vicinamibacterales bacterium]|nr:two-component regulator propeller domain-containing protein [Vicinamibacterales bacterium]